MPLIGRIAAATARAYGLFSNIAQAVDPYFSYVVSLLHGDGTNGGQNNTFLDSSSNNFTITRNGNTTQGSFSPFSQTGWSNYFDGTGDYLTLAPGAAFGFGTGDFTVETWFYYTGLQSPNTQYLFDARNSGQTNTWAFHANPNANTIVWFNGSSDFSSSSTVSINQWNHVAYVRSGTTGSMYFNGVRVGTQTDSTNYSVSPTTSYIGVRYNITEPILGYMSNARVVKGTAVYSGTTYTVPTAPLTAITNTSLLTCQSNRFRDASTNNFTITRNGDASVQPFSPFNPTTAYSASSIGGSGYFDGSGDYLTLSGGTPLTFGTGDFTIEFWYYSSNSGVQQILYDGRPSGTNGLYITLYKSTGNVLELYVNNAVVISGATVVNTTSWNHVALSRSGTSTKLFLNGVQQGSTYTDSNNYLNGTSRPVIGADGATIGNLPLNGYLSDLRVLKGTALYTAAFTPPTAPLTAITNTQLLLSFTNGAIFDNAAVADYETVGNAQISTSVKKYGTGSLAFDGTGDYLKTPVTDLLDFGTGDFTIECWAYFNNTSDSGGLGAALITKSGGGTTIYSSTNGGTTLTFYNGSGIVSGTIALTTWFHIAVSRASGTVKFFVNGTQTGSATHTSAVSFSGAFVGSQSASGGYLNGYIDDLRVSKGVARYLYNFTPPTAALPDIGGTITLTADPYYEYTTLLLPGNGTNGAQNNTFLDSSTNAFTITRNGNTTQGTFSPFSQTGWGNYFNGSTDSLSLADNAAWNMGSGDFTAEAWIYPTSFANEAMIMGQWSGATGGTTLNWALMMDAASAGSLRLITSSNGSSVLFDLSATSALTLNQWQHIAAVRSGTTFTIYVNGTARATTTNASALFDATNNFTIGVETTTPTQYYQGYISNLRITKGGALYTANFTPSITPLTTTVSAGTVSLLTCQSNRFLDSSSNAFAITINGSPSVQAFSPFNPTASWSAATYGGSGYFDGSGDYLSLSQATALSLGTGDFSVEAWVYPTANPSSFWSIIDARGSAANIPWAAGLRLVSGALKGTFFNGADIQGSITVPLNAWTHIVFSRVGSTLRSFINGVVDINTTMTTNLTAAGTQYIGAIIDPAYDTGYMTDVRIVKGSGVTSVTVPTAPLTAITNTQLLLSATNAGIYDVTSKNDLETVGNAQISTTQSKFGGSSIYFDGTGDGLTMPSAPLLQLGSGDFTIEAWIRFDKNLTYLDGDGIYSAALFGQQTTGGLAIVFRAASSAPPTSINYIVIGTSTTSRTISTALNTWYHVAVSRYAGTVYMFMNGVLQGTSFANTTNFVQSATQVGYLNITNFLDSFPGYINDLRVTKGIARYTSNFTPPTTAFLTL